MFFNNPTSRLSKYLEEFAVDDNFKSGVSVNVFDGLRLEIARVLVVAVTPFSYMKDMQLAPSVML